MDWLDPAADEGQVLSIRCAAMCRCDAANRLWVAAAPDTAALELIRPVSRSLHGWKALHGGIRTAP